MRRRPLKLHHKLSAALFLLLILLAALGISTVYFFSNRLSSETDSLTAIPIVNALASEISNSGQHLDTMSLLMLVRRADELLPGLRTYIVDPNGYIVANLSMGPRYDYRPKIDPRELVQFADNPISRTYPSYTEDPNTTGKPALFVSAPIQLNGKPYYLLAILTEIVSRRTAIYALDRFAGTYLSSVVISLVGVGLIASLVIFSLLTRRLSRLMLVVKQYRDGNYAARVNIEGDDEVGELAASVNSMAETIEGQIAQLNTRDQLRRELIASVSHDLRGPIGVLRLCLEHFAASDTVKSDAVLKERCQVVDRSVNSLSTLLAQLFELSKLETAEKKPELSPYPIEELLGELCDRYSEFARSKGLALQLEVPEHCFEVLCDPLLMERAISNLIENAVTYTLEGGFITLGATPQPTGLEVWIADTGVGIPEEDLPFVFDRAYRVQKWSSRNETSGGLGLAIVKRIIESHGSDIRVVSKEQEGSRFSFLLRFADHSSFQLPL